MIKLKGAGITGSVALGLTLFGGLSAQAVDHTWDNGAGDNDFTNPVNWVGDTLPTNAGRNKLIVDMNGTDKAVLSDGEIFNFSPLWVGALGDGEFEQTGGILTVTANQNDASQVGRGAFTGSIKLSGGTSTMVSLILGAQAGSTGNLTIDGGSLTFTKNKASSHSLALGLAGTGTVEIESGALVCRSGMYVGGQGTFSVMGAGASLIKGGTSSTGKWTQDSGGTLKVQIADNGLTPITLTKDGYATFALDSELDVSFMGGHVETNYWLVMEAESNITDNGLKFADSVDTSDWDMIWTENQLYVSYGGATLVDPDAETNLFVDAIVDTPDTWNLFAPEGGSTALSDQSSSGFSVNVDTVTESSARPVVAQEFGIDLNISEIGQSITVNFDVEVLDNVTIPNGEDFRFAFYDTNQNCQIIAGMLDFGMPQGTTMKMRVEEKVSLSNPSDESDDPTYTFVPGEYAGLCNGSTTLGQASTAPGSGIQVIGGVTHIESVITRTGSNEVSAVTYWSANSYTSICTAVINEAAPADPDGMPYSGKFEVLNGFGFKIFADAPYTPDGSYKISNYAVSYTASIPAGFSYNIADMTLAPSGDLTITLTDPIVGAVYTAQGTTDLVNSPMAEIGSYLSVAPGVITVPAADAAPYLTGKGFFNVALPVYEVVE